MTKTTAISSPTTTTDESAENAPENVPSGKPWVPTIIVAAIAFVYGMLQQPRYVPMSYRIMAGFVVAVMFVAVASVIALIGRFLKARWSKVFGWAFAVLLGFSVAGDIKKPNIERPVYIGKCEFDCWNE